LPNLRNFDNNKEEATIRDKDLFNANIKSLRLRVCLGFAYFAENENFLLKILNIKVKVS